MKVAQEAQPASVSNLYEEDFFEWTRRNAELLRTGQWSQADVEHIAEEIEDMGKRDLKELNSRLQVLVAHLLKWQLQPARRTKSWTRTITLQRIEIENVLEQSPSLKAEMNSRLAANYTKAVRRAMFDTELPSDSFSAQCPFTIAQILDPDFLP
jgi:hypothetical protein